MLAKRIHANITQAGVALCYFLFLLPSSCSDRGAGVTDPGAVEQRLSGVRGLTDTLPESISVPARGKRIHPDSLVLPVVVPLKAPSLVVPGRNNIHPVGTPLVVQIPRQLKTVTPGQNGTPQPRSLAPEGRVVPVKQPKPATALPFRIKDDAAYDIQYLDVEQGMVSAYMRSLLLDRHGYLWFGTSYGVSRFDGNRFLHYTTEEGLSDNRITSMLEDQHGNIWFGTRNGLTRYDGNYFTHYPSGMEGQAHEVKSMLEDDRGHLWFGTGGGAIRYDGATFTFYTTREGLINNNILALLEDDRGDLWFGTSEGISRFDGVRFTHYTTREGLTHNTVSSIAMDRDKNLWFGTTSGATRYDGAAFTCFSTAEGLIDNEIRSILPDSQGRIWFGTKGGAARYDGRNFLHFGTEEGLKNNEVRAILEDDRGNLWFATGGGGINRLNMDGFVHFTADKTMSDNGFTSIFEDTRGGVWFGTTGAAIRYDGDAFAYFNTETGLISDEIQSVFQDRRGDIWLGTVAGVSRLQPGNAGQPGRLTHYTTEQGLVDNIVRSIFEDRRGALWFATWKGVTRYEPDGSGTGSWTHFTETEGMLSNTVRCMMSDQRGNVWFGTDKGVSRFDGNNFTHYPIAEGMTGNDIRCMLEDRRGNLWLGTGGNGLSRFDPDNPLDAVTHYTTEQGLSHNFIWSLKEDREGAIWMSTENGITLMDLNTDDSNGISPVFFTFDKGDGLKRLDFQGNSVCLDRQNRLWWGSVGLVMLDLDQFELPRKTPQNIQITQIDVNQQFIDYRKLGESSYEQSSDLEKALSRSFDSIVAYQNYPQFLTLPHKLNHLSFHFSAIDWAAPQKIQYTYFMAGQDKAWSKPDTEPRAEYRNLSYGSYTLHVKARSEATVWSDPFEYRFTIRPPLTKTWIAWILYALLAGALAYGAYVFLKKRWQLQERLKREQERLKREREESVRLKELDSFKSRVYTNLTHEFRTPLTIILGMADQVEGAPAQEQKEGLARIRQNGRELLRLIDQLLDLARLENQSLRLHWMQGDIVPYLHYMTDSFYSFANSKNLSLQFFSTVEELVMDYDPEQIKQVMTNLLSNAIKFTPSGGAIKVRVARDQERLRIEVTDTGIGMAPEELQHVFERFYQIDASSTRKGSGSGIGLAHTQELVKLMEGNIEVESELDKGTTFRIMLPIRLRENTPAGIPEELTDRSVGATPANDAVASPQPAAGMGDLPEPSDTNPRPLLLIIEDNADVVAYLKICLGSLYQLDVAFNGKVGIEKALEKVPDLIISDVMMPEKDGLEVCHTLKNDEATSHIPIILLTAKADHDSRISGLRTGADAYLYKPFDKEELMVRIEMMIKNQQKLKAYFSRKFQHGFTAGQPAEETGETPAAEDAFIERIRQIVEANYADEDFGVPELSKKAKLSRSQLYRKMKALIDTPPSNFIKSYRLEKARQLLDNSDLNVTEVTYRTGFKDVPHFSKSFQDHFGYPPSDHHKKK